MKLSTRIKIGAILLGLVLFGALLHYNLPRSTVVQIIGTDVKRMDAKGRAKSGEKGQQEQQGLSVRDVRFINAVDADGKPRVFRNEDTGWGLPPYLKFNSADITAQAQTFTTSPEKPWVLVRYYGWRIRMLDAFPNVISVKQVPKGYSHFPWFNSIFLTLLAGVGTYIVLRVRRMWRNISCRFRKQDKSSTTP